MIETLAPVWDGNETWLVLGGMVLLAAFPGAFAILLPAYYVPLALMLFALVLRGISFEFRSQGGPLQVVWTVAFAGGSALAAFCQGAILGSFVGGSLQVVEGRFAGGPFDWLSLFTIVTGLGLVAGYGLLGACWLIWKTEDDTHIFARELAFTTLLSSGAAMVVVSLWTPLSVPQAPLPLIALAAWIGVLRSLWGLRDWVPFLCAIPLFLASLGELGARIWPQAVPGVMTIWEASSAHRTQVVLAGALLGIVPIILAYCLQLLDVQGQNACAGSENVRGAHMWAPTPQIWRNGQVRQGTRTIPEETPIAMTFNGALPRENCLLVFTSQRAPSESLPAETVPPAISPAQINPGLAPRNGSLAAQS
jgi:cytochrome bd ubiquinol oxidase subunit II